MNWQRRGPMPAHQRTGTEWEQSYDARGDFLLTSIVVALFVIAFVGIWIVTP